MRNLKFKDWFWDKAIVKNREMLLKILMVQLCWRFFSSWVPNRPGWKTINQADVADWSVVEAHPVRHLIPFLVQTPFCPWATKLHIRILLSVCSPTHNTPFKHLGITPTLFQDRMPFAILPGFDHSLVLTVPTYAWCFACLVLCGTTASKHSVSLCAHTYFLRYQDRLLGLADWAYSDVGCKDAHH